MSPVQPQRTNRALAAYAAAVLGFMILVILWGAVVRATGSGAGCGDRWPLCNGDFFPHHPRIATIIEFTHRSMSGICTVLVAALISWTFVARPRGDRARKAVVWSGVLLVTEALLGAVLVLGGYVDRNTSDARVAVQCIHFTNTMLLLGALSLTWWWLREPSATGSLSRERDALAGCCVGGSGADDSYRRDRIGGGTGRYSLPFTVIAGGAGAGLRCKRAIAGAHALAAPSGGAPRVRRVDSAVPSSFSPRRVMDRRSARASDRARGRGHGRACAGRAAGAAPAGRRSVLDRAGGSLFGADLRREAAARSHGSGSHPVSPTSLKVALARRIRVALRFTVNRVDRLFVP